jgi:D-lactate dehydrogenase
MPQLVYFGSQAGEEALLKEAVPEVEVKLVAEPLTPDTAGAAAEAELVSVFAVGSEVSAAALDKMPKVRFIATRSAGFDHIDLKACQERGIVVSSVPRYGETTVAEHTFALMLALSRRIFQSYQRTERMNFDRSGLQGFDLAGKTLGIVGTGNIGRRVAEIGRGFRLKVVAYDVAPDGKWAEKLGVTYVSSLADLLRTSDIISLHVPALPETHHLLNGKTMPLIKPGAILINTARGSLIDTNALLLALQRGQLWGVGLDVLEEENDAYDRVAFLGSEPDQEQVLTLLRNHLLVTQQNVIITPHNAFNSAEAVREIFLTTIDNIKGWLVGKPINAVLR